MKSYAKGRWGYFDLHHTDVEAVHTETESSVWIEFYSRKSVWPGSCYAALTIEDAEDLWNKLNIALARAKNFLISQN